MEDTQSSCNTGLKPHHLENHCQTFNLRLLKMCSGMAVGFYINYHQINGNLNAEICCGKFFISLNFFCCFNIDARGKLMETFAQIYDIYLLTRP